jgi:hypothetical protein
VVHLHLEGDLQLGADAIHARNQYRIHIFFFVDREQAAKAPDFTENTAGECLVGEVLDALLGAIRAVDVHSGIGIGDARTVRGTLFHG